MCLFFFLGLCFPVSQFSHSVVSNSLQPHALQHSSLPCPSSTPRACSDSCPLSRWCHPTILTSVVPFSSCCQSFPASGSFPMSWHFISSIYTVTHVFLCFVLLYAIFPFSYCSWSSQGRNTEVVCHSLLQWIRFCQNSPPSPIHLGWPYTAWLIVSLS